jgi:hypothetical protein
MANKSHPRRLGWDSFGVMGSPAAPLVRTAAGCTNRSRLLARSIALRRYGIVDIHPRRAGLDRYCRARSGNVRRQQHNSFGNAMGLLMSGASSGPPASTKACKFLS